MLKPLFFSVLLLASTQAHALIIQHTNTVFANMGLCVATFMLTSQDQEISNLSLMVEVQDADGATLESRELTLNILGGSPVVESQDVILDSEEVCSDNIAFNITAASGTVDGQTVNLLDQITVMDFKPAPIHINKP